MSKRKQALLDKDEAHITQATCLACSNCLTVWGGLESGDWVISGLYLVVNPVTLL